MHIQTKTQGKSIEGCTIKSWMEFWIVHSLSFYLRDDISYLAWTPRRAELRDKCFVQVFIIFTPFGISIHQCFCCNSCKHYYTVPADPSPNKTLRQTEIRFVYVYYQLESVWSELDCSTCPQTSRLGLHCMHQRVLDQKLTSSRENDMSRVAPVNRSSRSSRSKLSSQNWVPAWPNPINQQKIPSETLPCKSIFEDTSHKVLLVQSCRNITMWVDFCG